MVLQLPHDTFVDLSSILSVELVGKKKDMISFIQHFNMNLFNYTMYLDRIIDSNGNNQATFRIKMYCESVERPT